MAWIEFHDTVSQHPKIWALSRRLRVERAHAVGLMASLWSWAVTHAPSGELSAFPPAAIAEAAGFPSQRGAQLLRALKASGLVDPDGTIHDWLDYIGPYLAYRESHRKRQARYRQKKKAMEAALNAQDFEESIHPDGYQQPCGQPNGAPSGNDPLLEEAAAHPAVRDASADVSPDAPTTPNPTHLTQPSPNPAIPAQAAPPPAAWIALAHQRAALRGKAGNAAYIGGILRSWLQSGGPQEDVPSAPPSPCGKPVGEQHYHQRDYTKDELDKLFDDPTQ